ncbi:MAG: aldo/keto reductase family protein [Capsulimonadaceae bacterium]|nr:aldo/keto reductase family protein [Capsulimonadaceae bacterium]
MEYRKLGKYGIRVSAVSLGSWLTYGNASSDQSAEQCVDRAYELGINFFDTANVYAGGEAERVVGKALAKYERSSYVLATKVFFPMGSGPNDRGLSRKHIFEQCHKSLARLGVDYIDLYQCHRYDPSTPLEETLVALDDLARQGKILYYGVSEWSAQQIAHATDVIRLRGLHPIVSNQPQYNMLNRNIEKEVIPVCEREGIGQVVFSPLAQGLLTGKYKPGQPLPEGSRASDPKQNMFMGGGKLDDSLLESIQKLQPIAAESGLSMAQLALAWCLRKENISSVIIGASKTSQVDDNVVAADTKLSAHVAAKIDEALGKSEA